jgi:hypothetical protein
MRVIHLITILSVGGCASGPSTTVEPRQATPVSAGHSRTWDAVVDVFADRNIAIRTMDRSSGFIATEELHVRPSEGLEWADCGKNLGGAIGPTRAVYNVLVRGDSSAPTVKATVRWGALRKDNLIECTTKGTWESDAESEVKRRAESRGATGAAAAPPSAPAQAQARPRPAAPPELVDAVPPGTNWIADNNAKVYYQVGCTEASKVPPANRLFYQTEGALQAAGFRRAEKC